MPRFFGFTGKKSRQKNINMKSKFKVSFEVEIEFDENEMTEQEAILEITESMHFPCEDTDDVTIIEQSITERPYDPEEPQYRYLEIGETCKPGDEMENYGKWIPVHECHTSSDAPYIINSLSGRFRRKISASTEPQYRTFKEGEIIEMGDQFRFSQKDEWEDCHGGIGHKADSIGNFRKLIK